MQTTCAWPFALRLSWSKHRYKQIKDYQNTSTNLSKKTYPYQNPIKKPLISTFPIKGKGKLGLRRVGNGKKTLTDCEKENSEKRWGKGDFPEFGMNAIQEHAALENC